MATYKYSAPPSALTVSTTTTFPASGTTAFTTSDTFIFDDESLSASGITISGTTTTTLAIGTKTFVFTSFAPEKIASTNFVFADGGKLIIGDGISSTSLDGSANTLASTVYNDYLDGLGGIDTVTYAAALSAVTVDLSSSSAQATGWLVLISS